MPDPNTPPPAGPDTPGRPIDAWFDGDHPPWDNATGAPKAQGGASPVPPLPPAPAPAVTPIVPLEIDAPVVVPVVGRARPAVAPVAPGALPEARSVGPYANPRPAANPSPPSEPSRWRLGTTDPAVEPERPRSQVFLACSVLLAIIAAMAAAVVVLGYVLVVGFEKARTRTKATNNPAVQQPQNPAGKVVPPRNNRAAPKDDE